MLVFLSWSGDQSKAVARELQLWLQEVIQDTEPWMSTDIEKGSKWITELNAKLEHSKVGILCLTPDALESNWLHYEAGALAKTKDALVCSLLIDVAPADVQYPLAQFQQTVPTKEEMRSLLVTINKAVQRHGERGVSETVLDRLLERTWEQLNDALQRAKQIPPQRSAESSRPSDYSTPVEDIELMEEFIGIAMLARPTDAWTLEEIVPTVLASMNPGAPPSPPALMAAVAKTIEKKNLSKLLRSGLAEQANDRYSLTNFGVEYFTRVAERTKELQRKIANTMQPKGEV